MKIHNAIIAITQLKEEIEKQEQRALKENLKKLELKKKQELDKKKPFEFKTDKRLKEKEIKESEHPLLGKIKVVIGPNRTGSISVREGYDPEVLAENFMNSYSLKREYKDRIVNHIQQIIHRNTLQGLQKDDESPESEGGNRSMSRELKSITEESEYIKEQNFFNIPISKNKFGSVNAMQAQTIRQTYTEVENEDPNQNMMSPHFRGQPVGYPDANFGIRNNRAQPDTKSPNFASKNDNRKELSEDSDEKVEFNGFSPESSGAVHRRGSAASSFYAKPIENNKMPKR